MERESWPGGVCASGRGGGRSAVRGRVQSSARPFTQCVSKCCAGRQTGGLAGAGARDDLLAVLLLRVDPARGLVEGLRAHGAAEEFIDLMGGKPGPDNDGGCQMAKAGMVRLGGRLCFRARAHAPTIAGVALGQTWAEAFSMVECASKSSATSFGSSKMPHGTWQCPPRRRSTRCSVDSFWML